MREYKFRGKRLDNGEWVYGYYVFDAAQNIHQICTNHKGSCNASYDYLHEVYLVDPATVGQFTGLPDKNGVEIFGGDIVTDGKFKGKVFWDDTAANYAVYDPHQGIECAWEWYEVIGNVHDNPELLK